MSQIWRNRCIPNLKVCTLGNVTQPSVYSCNISILGRILVHDMDNRIFRLFDLVRCVYVLGNGDAQ